MLVTIREKSKGPILVFIIGAICLMFAATGVDSILGAGNKTNVAKVNGEKITQQELNEAIFLKKRQMLAQMGENIDPAMLDDKRLTEPALNDLVSRKLLLQIADKNNMLVADSEINKVIAKTPEFQKDGKFSSEVFQSLLANSGLTPSLYKRLFTMDILLQQVSSGVIETAFITDKDIAIETRFTHQVRDIRYITLPLANEKSALSVSDAEIAAYYEQHPEQFQTDESVLVEYIELNQADFNAEVSAAEIEDAYNQEVVAFDSREQREIAHILIQVDKDTSKEQASQQLNDIKKKLAEGQDFAELARTYSEDLGSKDSGGLLGLLDENAFPEEFVSAAKTLKQNEVSGIVETDSGLHLIQVVNVTTPQPPAFEQRKDAIKADLQLAKATPLYFEAVEKLKDLAFNSIDLAEPAAALNTVVKESPGITRKGGAGVFANRAVYQALFSDNVLKNGENSDLIELSPSQAVVVRVKQHNPAALIAFADVSTKAKDLATAEKAKAQLAVKAEALREQVFAGADIETLAHQDNYSWQLALASKRTNPDLDQEILNAAFKLPAAKDKQRAVEKVEKANGDFIVLMVSNVQDGKISDLNAMETGTIKSYIARAAGMEDFDALQANIKAKSDIDIF